MVYNVMHTQVRETDAVAACHFKVFAIPFSFFHVCHCWRSSTCLSAMENLSLAQLAQVGREIRISRRRKLKWTKKPIFLNFEQTKDGENRTNSCENVSKWFWFAASCKIDAMRKKICKSGAWRNFSAKMQAITWEQAFYAVNWLVWFDWKQNVIGMCVCVRMEKLCMAWIAAMPRIPFAIKNQWLWLYLEWLCQTLYHQWEYKHLCTDNEATNINSHTETERERKRAK